ncbi:hypothetical protein [Serinibacter arcticus]|uniref:Uncharacterized protein n=1 Tax=Serinibacter arcticus TaxID=1655435 RepID=A0A4Z1DW98_9MICO|nr:hypothetical protein [Serinibacter arcticus]TGO03855.1 hypothetical protein SERN_2867 [Serinibacter arcticus]
MFVQHLDGSSDPCELSGLPALIDELDDANAEESDVGVCEDFGWFVSAYASGTVVLVHAERPHDPELVLHGVPRNEMLEIVTELATGRLDDLRARPWRLEGGASGEG